MWEVIVFLATVLALIMVLRKLPVDLTPADKNADGVVDEKDKEKTPRELADEHFEKGELKKAENLYLKILGKEPDDAGLYNKLGLIYLQSKNFKDARSALKQALKLEPENDTFYNNLGLLYYEMESYDGAIDAYEKSIAINDKIPSRLVNLGLAYFMTKKYRKAADAYEKAIILDPRNEQTQELLKQAEEKLK
ncbi:MAG: tetratricopeptide repeat protein [Patescibacteria group bacterium]|jgi:Flp pilus assembly protein TadD